MTGLFHLSRQWVCGCVGIGLGLAACVVRAQDNRPPVALDQTASVVEGSEITITFNWSDPDNPPRAAMAFSILSGPTAGTLQSYNARYSTTNYPDLYYYRSNVGASADVVTWKCNDGQFDSGTGTVSIVVRTNTPPAALSGSTSVPHAEIGRALHVQKSDPDSGQSFKYKAVTLPPNGTLQYSDGSTRKAVPVNTWLTQNSWYYTPKTGFVGTDSFTWKCNDGIADSTNTATQTISVTNTTPTASNGTAIVRQGYTTKIALPCGDPESLRYAAVVLDTAPTNGGVTFSKTSAYYTPGTLEFTGEDSFVWRVTDGVSTSEPATCAITVADTPPGGTNRVLVIVKSTLLPELSDEVERLREDLEWDGWSARVESWSSTSASNLWSFLRSEYTNSGPRLAGAILIGDVPLATGTGGQTTDLAYWNMNAYQNTTARHIWVSRIKGNVPGARNRAGWRDAKNAGREPALTRQTLDSNHAYRTGQSRLPHVSFNFRQGSDLPPTDSFEVARVLEVWPSVSTDKPRPAILKGGECIQQEIHGNPISYHGAYAGGGGPDFAMDMDRVHDDVVQVRFMMGSNCESGRPGGVHNQTQVTRRGGAVLVVGASETTYSGMINILDSSDATFRRALAEGKAWGDAFLRSFPMTDTSRLMFYGDLSLPAMKAPPNAPPSVPTLTRTAGTVYAHRPVTFTASVADSDAAKSDNLRVAHEHSIEWFPTGHNYGRTEPAYVTDSTQPDWTNVTHIYTTPGTYTVRAQAVDEWQAVGYKEITVTVIVSTPVAVTDQAHTGTDEPVTIAVLENDSEPSGAPLYLEAVSEPAHGTATVNGDGTATYTPPSGWHGVDRFDYWVRNDYGKTGTAVVTVCVAPRFEEYERRMDIVLAETGLPPGRTLTNFPALVRLGEAIEGFRYADFRSPVGDDLRFSDAGGRLIPHETVSWNTQGVSEVWVRVPELTGTDTVVRAHWGAWHDVPAANGGPWVWSEGYVLVSHDGGKTDSTANGNHGAAFGGVVAGDATGVCGVATYYPGGGTNDYMSVGRLGAFGSRLAGGYSLSLWVKTADTNISSLCGSINNDSKTYLQTAINRYYNTGSSAGANEANAVWVIHRSEEGKAYDLQSRAAAMGAWRDEGWHMLAVAAKPSANAGTILLDGLERARTAGRVETVVTTANLQHDLVIGAVNARGTISGNYSGFIDEFRLSDVVRSVDWLRAEYRTVASNAQFAVFGPVETTAFDPNRDSDNDGMSDADEILAGTDPRDPASRLRLRGLACRAEGFDFQVHTATGRLYDLFYKDDLLGTNGWLPLTNDCEGTGDVLDFTDPSPATQRFYRVRVRLP